VLRFACYSSRHFLHCYSRRCRFHCYSSHRCSNCYSSVIKAKNEFPTGPSSLSLNCKVPSHQLRKKCPGCQGYIHALCGRVLSEDEGKFKEHEVVCPKCDYSKQPPKNHEPPKITKVASQKIQIELPFHHLFSNPMPIIIRSKTPENFLLASKPYNQDMFFSAITKNKNNSSTTCK